MDIRIKPLEWKELSTGWIAHTSFHAYEVVKTDHGFMATYANSDFAWGAEDAMKAAAQADYERRALSALSPAPVGVTGKLKQKKSMLDECCSAIKPCFYQQSDPYSLCDPCKRAKTLASHEPAPRDVCEKCRGNGGWNTAGAMIAEGMYETIWNLCPDCGPGYALRRVREIAVLSEAAPDCMAEIIKVADMALGEKTPLPGWMIEPTPTDTQEGLSEASEVVAWLCEDQVMPDNHSVTLDGALAAYREKYGESYKITPLVRQSALTACRQEVERLRKDYDAACEEAAKSYSDKCSAEARIAELVKALEELCSYSDEEYVPNAAFAKARATLGGQSNE